jgi:hypothetical protein
MYGLQTAQASNASFAQAAAACSPTHMDNIAEVASRIEKSADRIAEFLARFHGETARPDNVATITNCHRESINRLYAAAEKLEGAACEIEKIG